MLLNAIAVRYAQALFDLAKGKNQIDEQLAELLKAQLILRDHSALAKALQSPTIPSAAKKSILEKVFKGRISDTTLYTFYVMVNKNREAYLDPIIENYRELVRQNRGQVEVVVQSPAALGAPLAKQLEEKMRAYTGKQVELKFEVVPELLGGVVIRIGDRIIDGSVRHQLNQIHERLSKAGAAAVGG